MCTVKPLYKGALLAGPYTCEGCQVPEPLLLQHTAFSIPLNGQLFKLGSPLGVLCIRCCPV